MTDTETIQSRTIEKYRQLNEQLKDFLKNVLLVEKSFQDEIERKNDFDQGGISLLSIKNDLLLHYLINLVGLIQHQSSSNKSFLFSSSQKKILRLCEIRTYLEKIRPIESKLKYEMDKLLNSDNNQQLAYRANINNFQRSSVNQEKNDDEPNVDSNEENKEESRKEKSQIYRPPKLVPMEFDEDAPSKSVTDKIDKRLEYLKRRAYHSEILNEFKSKYSDEPEEIHNTQRSLLMKENRAYKEKIEYEENYMKRLPETKRERLQLQRSMNKNSVDHILDHLDDADVLFDESNHRSTKKKTGRLSRKNKKRLEKKKTKTTKRFKSRK